MTTYRLNNVFLKKLCRPRSQAPMARVNIQGLCPTVINALTLIAIATDNGPNTRFLT